MGVSSLPLQTHAKQPVLRPDTSSVRGVQQVESTMTCVQSVPRPEVPLAGLDVLFPGVLNGITDAKVPGPNIRPQLSGPSKSSSKRDVYPDFEQPDTGTGVELQNAICAESETTPSTEKVADGGTSNPNEPNPLTSGSNSAPEQSMATVAAEGTDKENQHVCGTCNYRTKYRCNLLRHLNDKSHVEDAASKQRKVARKQSSVKPLWPLGTVSGTVRGRGHGSASGAKQRATFHDRRRSSRAGRIIICGRYAQKLFVPLHALHALLLPVPLHALLLLAPSPSSMCGTPVAQAVVPLLSDLFLTSF